MRPDLTRRASGTTTARLALFLFVSGGLLGAGLLVLIAGGVSGIARAIILAILTPTLVVSVLILWRSAQAVSQQASRRRRTIADLQDRGVIGALTLGATDAHWADRINRGFVLPSGPHLLTLDAASASTADGQARLRVFYDLLGSPYPADSVLPLPPRSTLALIQTDGDVHVWDLTALIERADAENDMAREELLELELHVQQRAMEAIQHLRRR